MTLPEELRDRCGDLVAHFAAESHQWSHLVPGAEEPWSGRVVVPYYDEATDSFDAHETVTVYGAAFLTSTRFESAVVPILALPEDTGLASTVKVRHGARQSRWTCKGSTHHRGVLIESLWVLENFRGANVKVQFFLQHDAAPPSYPQPPSYSGDAPATPRPSWASSVGASPPDAVALSSSLSPHQNITDVMHQVLSAQIRTFLREMDEGVEFRGHGLASQDIRVSYRRISGKKGRAAPEHLEALVRLKGVWTRIDLGMQLRGSHDYALALVLPGGNLKEDEDGIESVLEFTTHFDAPRSRQDSAPSSSASPGAALSHDKWTFSRRKLDKNGIVVRTDWKMRSATAPDLPPVFVTFELDNPFETLPRGTWRRLTGPFRRVLQ